MADKPTFGLTTKVLLPLLTLVLIFSISLSWLINSRDAANQQSLLRSELENFIDLQAQSLAPLMWSFETDAIAAIFEGYAHFPDIQSIALYDDHNRLVNHLGDIAATDFNPNLRQTRDIFSDRKVGADRIGSITITFQDGRLRHYRDIRQREDLMVTFALMLLIAVSTLIVVRLGVSNPLRRLLDSLERAKSEAVREPVIWTSRDELGQVVAAYNSLLQQEAEAEKRVAAYRDHLEDLVAQRTTELERDRNNLRIVLAELSKRSAYLNAVIEGAGTGVVCTTPDGQILEANAEFTRFVHIDEDTLGKMTLFGLMSAEDAERLRDQVKRIQNKEIERFRTECLFRQSSGEKRWGTLTIAALSAGDDDDRLISVIDDVTDLKRSHEQFRALLESAPDPMVITTADDLISVVNLQAESLFGCSRYDLIGVNIQTLFSRPTPEEMPSVQNSADGEQEIFAIRQNGDLVPVDVSSNPIQTDDGVLIARTLRDASLRKESRAQMLKARRMAEEASTAKSNFLANMSHEIRTPMNAIIGLTYLVLTGDLRPRERDYLTKIQAAAQSLLGIINDILDFSKIEAGKMSIEAVDFNVEEIFKTLTAALSVRVPENGPEFMYTIDPAMPRTLVGDPQRLIQVLLNLGSNAIKFTKHGDVHIACNLLGQDDTHVHLDFSVTDTGIGMSEEHMSRLFQAFSQADESITRRFGGTGLGLAISQQLVRLMGSKIEVSSQLGQGSCFSFKVTLPIARQAVPPSPFPDTLFFAGLTVMVVDDNVKSAGIINRYLTAFGSHCEIFHSGAAALARVEQGGPPLGLILLDWRMPEMNGQETALRLRCQELTRHTPIVAMVGTSDRDYLSHMSDSLGIAAWTVKPFSPSDLLDAILSAFGRVNGFTASVNELTSQHQMQGRILLVEDNDLNQQVATELLAAVGLQVTIANNGQEGVDLLSLQPFDLVLMDIQMPVLDGYAATKILRQDPRFAELPIIAMTANAMGSDRQRALNAGMNDHIPKPIDVNTLYETLKRWLPPTSVPDALPSPNPPPLAEPIMIQSNDNAVVDAAVGLKNAANNPGLYKRLVQKFVDREHDVLVRLSASFTDQDRETAIRTVHTLKSSSLTLGALHLGDVSARLEAFWKGDGPLSADLPDMDELAKALPPVMAHFQAFLAGTAPAAGTPSSNPLPPIEQVTPHLIRLEQLIADSDTEASVVAEKLATVLTGTSAAKNAQTLVTRIQMYEFDLAKALLADISTAVKAG